MCGGGALPTVSENSWGIPGQEKLLLDKLDNIAQFNGVVASRLGENITLAEQGGYCDMDQPPANKGIKSGDEDLFAEN